MSIFYVLSLRLSTHDKQIEPKTKILGRRVSADTFNESFINKNSEVQHCCEVEGHRALHLKRMA